MKIKLKEEDAHLIPAIEQMKINLAQKAFLNADQTKVVRLGSHEKWLGILQSNGSLKYEEYGHFDAKIYRVHPDADVEIEPDIIKCEIKESGFGSWDVKYPIGGSCYITSLGFLRCDGYEFLGWYNKLWDKPTSLEPRRKINNKFVNATHSLWRKI